MIPLGEDTSAPTVCVDVEGHEPTQPEAGGPVYCRKCHAPLRRPERSQEEKPA